MLKERLDRLLVLRKIKEDATQKAFADWAHAKDQYTQNKQRYDQLAEYRVDYMMQLDTLGRMGVDLGRLRNRIDFIHQLDSAMVQLGMQLGQLARVRVQMETLFKEAKASEEAVGKLIIKLLKTEEQRVARQEQKDLDEYAQKQWYSKNLNDETNRFEN